jgi:uncharacterized membrane protein
MKGVVRRGLSDGAVWWLGAVLVLSAMAVLKYESLHFTVMDLGAFISQFHGVTYLNEWWRIWDNHVWPFLFPYAWLYSLSRWTIGPEVTLIAQAVLLTAPIYWLREYHGRLVALTYLLYFPLWFNGVGNFHLDHLVVPLLAGFFLCKESGRLGWATVAALLLAFVKEPFALQTAACGAYFLASEVWSWKQGTKSNNKIFCRNSRAVWYGLGLILFGLGYFHAATSWVIPRFTNELSGSLNTEAFSWMGQDFVEAVWYVITHPLIIVEEVITTPKKIVYLVAIFGSLGFVSVLYPGPLLVAVPILAISMLSHFESYYGLGHHYTAGLIVPMIFAFVGGVPRAKVIWKRVGLSTQWFLPMLIILIVTMHVTLAPSPIGRLFWTPKVWSYHYTAYFPKARDAMIKKAIEQHIPMDPLVNVTVQNSVNWAPLVERRHLLLFPSGITGMVKVPVFHSSRETWLPNVDSQLVLADYVVIDMKRPWYLVDNGCEWYFGKCQDEKAAAQFLDHVVGARRVMGKVFEEDGFVILRRRN